MPSLPVAHRPVANGLRGRRPRAVTVHQRGAPPIEIPALRPTGSERPAVLDTDDVACELTPLTADFVGGFPAGDGPRRVRAALTDDVGEHAFPHKRVGAVSDNRREFVPTRRREQSGCCLMRH